MANVEQLLAEHLNNINTQNLIDRLENLARNMYVWEGLPEKIESRHIESALYHKGQAIFFEDDKLGWMCLPCQHVGQPNAYGDYVKYRAQGHGSFYRDVDIKNAVLIRNNLLCKPTKDTLKIYAERINEIDRTLDVNVKAQKTPRIIACDENNLSTFKAIFKQIDGNCPRIYADSNLNLNSLEVLDITAPYVCDKLADYKHDVWNEAMTFLSINNANTDKRERLVTSEVDSNNEFIEYNGLYMETCRKEAAEKMSKLFGNTITVKRREVEEDSTIHNGTKTNSGKSNNDI